MCWKALCLIFMISADNLSAQYLPSWESLDSRPIPEWFDEAKIGIFIHWGVFSVPGFANAWFWYDWLQSHDPNVIHFMEQFYPPDFTYADFAPMFKAEFFDPETWVDLFKDAGAKYVVLTSKHAEGFTNWPSKASWNWNSMDVGPKRDLVGELVSAVRNGSQLRVGLYHCLNEFFNPLYIADKQAGLKTNNFVTEKTMPEMFELINNYKPDLLWSDFYEYISDKYWNSTGFLAWLYNESPVKNNVVTNDRWGDDTLCRHGGYFTCDDRYDPGVLQHHKWEMCMTLDRYAWVFRRNSVSRDYLSPLELLTKVARAVSCGGNILINVGPTAYGTIPPIMEERLRQLGAWLKVNGEAIYSSQPWICQNDNLTSTVWFTSRKAGSATVAYAISLGWPRGGVLSLGCVTPNPQLTVIMLGQNVPLTWKTRTSYGIDVSVPTVSDSDLPCRDAWVFKITVNAASVAD